MVDLARRAATAASEAEDATAQGGQAVAEVELQVGVVEDVTCSIGARPVAARPWAAGMHAVATASHVRMLWSVAGMANMPAVRAA